MNEEPRIQLKPMTFQEQECWHKNRAMEYSHPGHRVWGRDMDILQIERLLCQQNLLVIHGENGCGKTTLLKYLAYWWQKTHFVRGVFYFDYDDVSWTLKQMLEKLKGNVLSREKQGMFSVAEEDVKLELIVQELKSRPSLLILDHLNPMAERNGTEKEPLSDEELEKIHTLIRKLRNGRTIVLVSAENHQYVPGKETWADNAYNLEGLDAPSARQLAEEILKRINQPDAIEAERVKNYLASSKGNPGSIEKELRKLETALPQARFEKYKPERQTATSADTLANKKENKTKQAETEIEVIRTPIQKEPRQKCNPRIGIITALPIEYAFMGKVLDNPEDAHVTWGVRRIGTK